MTYTYMPNQRLKNFFAENFRDEAHAPMLNNPFPVTGHYPGTLLPPML